MTRIEMVMNATDWPLLRQQKLDLLKVVWEMDGHALDGLVSFLDAIQAAAVGDGVATETEVFGLQEGECA